MVQTSFFRRHIALPQDHGSWVFLFSPIVIGLFAGGAFTLASLALVTAAIAAFLLRQPVTTAVKVFSGRRPRTDLRAALFWAALYSAVAWLAVGTLVGLGHGIILWLAVPALPVFGWHLYLVSRREERHQPEVEILATGVLALTAPAALWVGSGSYDPKGWLLWVLTWSQSAASIVYAYLRLAQRGWPSLPDRPARFRAGWRALAYTSFNSIAAATAGLVPGFLPRWIFIPFMLQWLETLWGIEHPATGWRPVAIGMRQLAVSALFTLAFILCWRP